MVPQTTDFWFIFLTCWDLGVKVKTMLPLQREHNFQGLGALKKHTFFTSFGSQIRVENNTPQESSFLSPKAHLEHPKGGPRAKMGCHKGSQVPPPGTSKIHQKRTLASLKPSCVPMGDPVKPPAARMEAKWHRISKK